MNFFKKLGAAIASMWKKAPAISVAITSTVNFIVPFVQSLDVLIAPELAPVLNPILDKVKVGISALKVTIQDATPEGQSNLTSIVGSINQHLAELVAAAQIKNPELATKIQAVATLVTGELNAIHGA
jgi:hypothetical protein